MLCISGNSKSYCPYRDALKIDTASGRVSWYQLLAAHEDASPEELVHRWNQRRTLVTRRRADTGDPVWSDILDELDRALACLSHPRRRAEYDADTMRRDRQTSLIRPLRQRPQPPDELPARSRFEPLRLIGRGSDGTKVFEAYEFTLGRTVAVKCLEKDARTESRCQTFLEEARFLASISHPNLIEVHSVNEKNHCYATEFLPTGVAEHFTNGRMDGCSPDQVTEFLKQSLSVLQCLHERGVVHGGICLNSYRVSESGVVKLTDAPGCTAGGLFRKPKVGQICVAPELLSPETFGEPQAAVDLYMLGFAAVELLAGNRLSEWMKKVSESTNIEQQQWLQWHSSPLEQLPSLRQLVPEISADAAAVIERLCQKQTADRYPSATEALGVLCPEPDPIHGSANAATHGNPQHARMPAQAARVVGGNAPVITRTPGEQPAAVDILTVLQDPQLLWRAIRTSRKLQFGCGALACLMIAITLLPPGAANEVPQLAAHSGPAEIETAAAPEPDWQREFTPDENGMESDQEQRRFSEFNPGRMPELKLQPQAEPARPDQELPSRHLQASSFPDLDSLPLIPTTTRRLLPPAAKPERSHTGLHVVKARPFPVRDVQDSEQLKSLHILLKQLRDARSSQQRKQLLIAARRIAPEDPRPLFVYAATYAFGTEGRQELQSAVQLSGPNFTQPQRKLVEAILRSSLSESQIADTVLAELIEFRRKLNPSQFDPESVYDWEWVGRVIGCLESVATNSEAVRMVLAANVPRLLEGNHTDVTDAIERGREWIRSHGYADKSAPALFIASPRIEIDLCLETLI